MLNLEILVALCSMGNILATAPEQCDTTCTNSAILIILESLVRSLMTGTHTLTTGQNIIGLLILLVMYTVIWDSDQNVAILVDGLELLILTLPEEMNVLLDGKRAHMMTLASVDHQVTMLGVISYYSPLKE